MDVTEGQWLEGTKLFQFSFDVAAINELIACKELESERMVCRDCSDGTGGFTVFLFHG